MQNLLLLLSILLLPFSCHVSANQKPSLLSRELAGRWTDTTVYNDSSRVLIHELDLRRNGQFTSKSFNYKGYRNGVPTELSAWSEDRGQVTQQADTLWFALREETVWDSFYPGRKPQTKATTGYLFNNCTFRLRGDTLELIHTSDDAPFYRSTYTRLRSK